jgi:hypothetical protein
VATATLSMTQVAHAQLPPPKIQPNQAAIQAPPGNVAYLVGHATGTQNYQCSANADNTLTWKLVEPVAELVTDNGQLIEHSKGPTWTFKPDGSGVIRDLDQQVVNVASPDPAAIPWLLVPVEPAPGATNGKGDLLTGTTFIQRVNTTGGLAPTRACTAGETENVDYTADYYFYRAAGKPSNPGKPGA